MADNTYRPSRSRDPIAGGDADPLAGDTSRDPLAELARLIGQGSRANEFDRSARHDGAVETLDHGTPTAGDEDVAADRDYAAPREPERYADEDYVRPRLPEPYPSDHDDAGYDERHAPAQRYEQEPADNYDDPHDAAYQAPYRDERYDADDRDHEASRQPPYADEERSVARQQSSLAPQARDDEYETDERWDDRAEDGQADEGYEDETASPPRRRGIAFIAAMLGLVLVGASGAVAYRSMFGGAILAPAPPPVIKAGDGPNKIIPRQEDAQAGAGQPGAANPAAPEKLVSREEQPVAVQPPNAPPRVVSTIPVPPPGAAPAPPGAFPALGPNVLGAAPLAAPMPAAPAPRVAAPSQPAAAAPATPGEPKKVHTVAIHPDQPGSGDGAAAAPPPAAAPAPRARTPEAARPAPAPRGGNAPLSLVPGAPAAAPAEPPRRHEARTEAPSASAPVATAPAPAAPVATALAVAAPASSGYAVQVTSQRSESEAQSAFQALQRKYPGQLGDKAPIIHRADLGDKGTYYRAMVGPYPSSEAAASFCSSLKAAGGTCLVQRN